MSASTRSSRTGSWWCARLLLLLGLALITTTAIYGARPIHELYPPHEFVLDVDKAQPDGGIAYRLTLPLTLGPEIASDKDGGRSPLIVLEDGTALVAHAGHQGMRDGARGHFSHWGETLYVTAGDGSDPRHNGRHYVARLPREAPPWASEALLAGFAAGAALTLLALLLPGLRPRRFGTALPLLAVVGVGALLVMQTSWWSAFRAVDLARGAAARPAAHHALAATRSGNVTRLLPGADGVSFSPRGELPAQDDALHVSFVPEPGVAIDGDFARLDPGGPGLVAILDPPVTLTEIAEILVPARIAEGGDLELRLIDAIESDQTNVQVTLPAQARDGLQPLVIRRPFEFFLVREGIRIGRVELALPSTAAHGALLHVDEVVLAGPSARFLQAVEGQDTLSQGDQLRPTRWQSVPGRFTVPLDGEGRLVKGSIGLFGRSPPSPVRFRVSHVDGGGAEQLLCDGELTSGGIWNELRAQLTRLPTARDDALVFDVAALPPGTAVGWANWRLVDTSRPGRRVLVALLDTVRIDAISAFGGDKAQTPVLDGLARSGVRFDRCYSQAHWTRPSMPSIMTGRYVAATGVETVGQQLPSSYVTLAETFADAGFLTIGDVANTNAGPSSGLDQGWDQLRLYRDPGLGPAQDQLSGELSERLAQVTEEDLLLYVHLMDAHGPYGPREAPQGQGPGGSDVIERNDTFDRDWILRPTAEGRRHWYYRDIEVMDRALGDFLDSLEMLWGPAGRQALSYAIVADHGEYLGEHGKWGHGWYQLLPEVVHVPLILGGPALAAGSVVTTPVENIDVAPTLLELLGIPADALPDVDGRSLLPLLRDGDTSQHTVAVAAVQLGAQEQLSVYAPSIALLGDQRQLVRQLALDPRGATTSARNIAPGDSDDASPEHDAESLAMRTLRTRLATRFDAFWKTHVDAGRAQRSRLWEAADDEPPAVDPVALRQLEALGYLQRREQPSAAGEQSASPHPPGDEGR